MAKAADAFRSIGEVAQLVGVAPHVLRYWETQFPLFSPMKRKDGRRYFRPDDIRLAAGLCQILRHDGVSIPNAKALMRADKGAAIRQKGIERLERRPILDSAELDTAQIESVAETSSLTPSLSSVEKPDHHGTTSGHDLPLFPDLTDSGISDQNVRFDAATQHKYAPNNHAASGGKGADRDRAARVSQMSKPTKTPADAGRPHDNTSADWLARLQSVSGALKSPEPGSIDRAALLETAQMLSSARQSLRAEAP